MRLLGLRLEDATPEERQVIYAQMPAAARVMWKGVGVRSYRRYIARVRTS